MWTKKHWLSNVSYGVNILQYIALYYIKRNSRRNYFRVNLEAHARLITCNLELVKYKG